MGCSYMNIKWQMVGFVLRPAVLVRPSQFGTFLGPRTTELYR